jgi:hypothetical protein
MWAERGECKNSKQYMMDHCKESCKYCTGKGPRPKDEVELHPLSVASVSKEVGVMPAQAGPADTPASPAAAAGAGGAAGADAAKQKAEADKAAADKLAAEKSASEKAAAAAQAAAETATKAAAAAKAAAEQLAAAKAADGPSEADMRALYQASTLSYAALVKRCAGWMGNPAEHVTGVVHAVVCCSVIAMVVMHRLVTSTHGVHRVLTTQQSISVRAHACMLLINGAPTTCSRGIEAQYIAMTSTLTASPSAIIKYLLLHLCMLMCGCVFCACAHLSVPHRCTGLQGVDDAHLKVCLKAASYKLLYPGTTPGVADGATTGTAPIGSGYIQELKGGKAADSSGKTGGQPHDLASLHSRFVEGKGKVNNMLSRTVVSEGSWGFAEQALVVLGVLAVGLFAYGRLKRYGAGKAKDHRSE